MIEDAPPTAMSISRPAHFETDENFIAYLLDCAIRDRRNYRDILIKLNREDMNPIICELLEEISHLVNHRLELTENMIKSHYDTNHI